jgi:hypothetical protein
MIHNFKKYIIAFLFFGIAGSFVFTTPCFAASAKVEVTCEKTNVTVGDKVNAYININSTTTFTDFEANLQYDNDILEYVGNTQKVSGANGDLRISDINVANGGTTRKYALQFKAKKVGESNLSIIEPKVYDESSNELSVSSDEVTVKVNAQVSASTNANLKSLITEPEMDKPFNKNTHVYNADVDSKTDQLFITAVPEDKKATVSISGNDSLKEGKNKVVIKVLAESGNVIEYIINVNKEQTPKITPTTEPESTPTTGSTGIIQNGSDKYLALSGMYKLLEAGEEISVPDGYVKTQATISDVSVTAYVPEDDMQSDFLLIYAESPDGKQGFYQYDKIEKTIQRYSDSLKETNSSDVNSKKLDQYKANLNKAAVAIAVLSVAVVLLLYISMKLSSKKKRRKR